MSWNIWDGGGDRLERIAAIAREARPDALALIEADSRVNAETIARDLSMRLAYGDANSEKNIAWCAREAFLGEKNWPLPALTKTLLQVTIPWEQGELILFATHLGHERDARGEEQRVREVETILGVLRAQGDRPHLLCGDFNALAPGDTLRPASELTSKEQEKAATMAATPRRALALLVEAGYVDAFRALHPDDPGYTFKTFDPYARLDYIWLSPSLARHLRACEHLPPAEAVSASDHAPLWVDLQ